MVKHPAENVCTRCDLHRVIKGNAFAGWEGAAPLLQGFGPRQAGRWYVGSWGDVPQARSLLFPYLPNLSLLG